MEGALPYDSNGVFSLTPGYLAVAGQTIQPSQHNPPLEDIVAQGLSNVLVRDGRAPMVGNLKMNTFRITGMGDGANAMDAVTKQQMDTAVTGATDTVAYNALKFSTKSATYTAVKSDNATAFRFTAAATLNLTAAATLGANWWCEIQATSGNVTIDPNAAETIDGQSTVIIQNGQIARISCNGTAFVTEIVGNPFVGPHLQGFSFGLGLSTNATDAANDVDIAVGAAASDTSPFYLMQLTSPLTKRLDATWAAGSNQGGLDTGSVSAAATYYIWLVQRSDTLVTDVLFSLSSTAPTMPASYDRKRLIGSLVRESSANSAPSPTGKSITVARNPPLTPSGSAFTIAGIPAGAQTVTVKLNGLTLSTTTQLILRLGTSGGIASSGYVGKVVGFQGNALNSITSTSYFALQDTANVSVPIYGHLTLIRAFPGSGKWTIFGSAGRGAGGMAIFQGGVDLGSELTQVQLTTVEGTSTLSGSSSVSIELEF